MKALRLTAAEKVLAALGLIALLRWGLSALLPSVGTEIWYLLLMGQQALLYGLPALLLKTGKKEKHLRRPRPLRLGAIAFTAVLHQAALSLVTLVVGQLMIYFGLTLRASAPPMPATLLQWALALAACAAVPALCEEGLFRGRALPALMEAFSPRAGFWCCGVLFALMHGQPAAFPAHLAVGLMLGVLYLKDGLGAAITYHLVFNAASLVMGRWQSLEPGLLLGLMALLCLGGLMAGLALAKGVELESGKGAQPRARYWAMAVGVLLLPPYLIALLPQ